MNVRLKKTFGWYSGVIHKDVFVADHYTAEFSMITVSDNSEEQNIAYERMKMFMHGILDDAIFIRDNHQNIDTWNSTGARIVALPEEPVDQIIGIMLYLKLNAIMENRIVITDVEIWSKSGDSMSYLHSHGESLGALAMDGWWTDPRPCWTLPRDPDTKEKIVSLDRVPEWKDYSLEWENTTPPGDSVVFANFGKNEK